MRSLVFLMAYVLILPYLPSNKITYEIARHGAAGSAIGTGVGVFNRIDLLLYHLSCIPAKGQDSDET